MWEKINEENINTNKYPRTERRRLAYIKDYITEENSIKYNVDYCYLRRTKEHHLKNPTSGRELWKKKTKNLEVKTYGHGIPFYQR